MERLDARFPLANEGPRLLAKPTHHCDNSATRGDDCVHIDRIPVRLCQVPSARLLLYKQRGRLWLALDLQQGSLASFRHGGGA